MRTPSRSAKVESAQEQQDREIARFIDKSESDAAKASPQPPAASSSSETSSKEYDPIGNAMRRNPGLTREQAEKIAEAFGY